MNVQLTPRTLAAVLGAVVAVLAIGGWFGLVSAQRSTSASLETKALDAQTNLTALQQAEAAAAAAAKASKGDGKGKGADKTKSQAALLETAFPSELGMPSILLQVQTLASASGVSLESFAPSLPTPVSGYDSVPINVTVNGRYRAIQRFVHALRAQAGASGGRVHASGRLFSVETVGITVGPEGAPELSATIVLDAFVYSGVVPPVDPAATTDPATSTPAGGTS